MCLWLQNTSYFLFLNGIYKNERNKKNTINRPIRSLKLQNIHTHTFYPEVNLGTLVFMIFFYMHSNKIAVFITWQNTKSLILRNRYLSYFCSTYKNNALRCNNSSFTCLSWTFALRNWHNYVETNHDMEFLCWIHGISETMKKNMQ